MHEVGFMGFTRGVLTGFMALSACGCGSQSESLPRTVSSSVPDGAFLTPVTPLDQSARAGEHVVAPEVVILGSDFSAVAGVRVEFVSSSGSTVDVAEAVTDVAGLASAESWQLGRLIGAYTVDARLLRSGESATFRAEATSDYRIEVRQVAAFSASQTEAFERATRRWSGVILNDLPDVEIAADVVSTACGVVEADDIVVDDLIIYVNRTTLDGVGGRVARVGPCLVRDGGAPAVSVVEFDAADLDVLRVEGGLEEVVLHQFGHAVGFGLLWLPRGLVTEASVPGSPSANPQFTGRAARAEFARLSGQSDSSVPVQSGARPGVSDIHWRQGVLPGELMAPLQISTNAGRALSVLTTGSLDDLGFYTANAAAAGPYAIASASPAEPDDFYGCEALAQGSSSVR
ncbi:MAG: leishmanolysin-related zinc metalloendopeptidase [Myxococcota bacterium]